MKKTMQLLAIMLLALPQTMSGQAYEGAISVAFETILNTKGVAHTTTQDVHRNSSTGGTEEKTTIHNVTVGRANFKLLDGLKSAFAAEDGNATSIYTCIGAQDDTYRQTWAVKMKNGGNFLIGQKSGSSYAIATFDDPNCEGYRTVYAAEWWDTDDKDLRKGVLLCSYGEKPAMVSYQATARWGKDDNWSVNLGDMTDMQKAMNRADSLFKVHFPDGHVDFGKMHYSDSRIDYTTDPKGWARQAMTDVESLNASDWLRLFGMLTQLMIDRAQKESDDEDMVVAAGILLDMCKHAIDVEPDERAICADRLKEVATQLQSRSKYVSDLLNLAAKKLQKK